MATPPPDHITEALVRALYVRTLRSAPPTHACSDRCEYMPVTTVVVEWLRGVHVCCPGLCRDEPMICPFKTPREAGRAPVLTMRNVREATATRSATVNGCKFALIPSVYVCRETGAVHLCGDRCKIRPIDDGSMQVEDVLCPLTQQQFGLACASEQHHIVAALRNKTMGRHNRYDTSTQQFTACMRTLDQTLPRVLVRCSDRLIFMGVPPPSRTVSAEGAREAVAEMLRGTARCIQSAAYAVAVCVLSNRLRAVAEMGARDTMHVTCVNRLIKGRIEAGETTLRANEALSIAFQGAQLAASLVPYPPFAVTDEVFAAVCTELSVHVCTVHKFLQNNQQWVAAARRSGVNLGKNVLDYTSIAAGLLVLLSEDLVIGRTVVSRGVKFLSRMLPHDNLQSCGIHCSAVTDVVSGIKKTAQALECPADGVWPTAYLKDDPPLNERLRTILRGSPAGGPRASSVNMRDTLSEAVR